MEGERAWTAEEASDVKGAMPGESAGEAVAIFLSTIPCSLWHSEAQAADLDRVGLILRHAYLAGAKREMEGHEMNDDAR